MPSRTTKSLKLIAKALLTHRLLVLIAIMGVFTIGIISTPTSLKSKEPKIPIPKTVIIKPKVKPKPAPAPVPVPIPAPVPAPKPVVTHSSTPAPATAPSPGTGVSGLSPSPSSGSSGSGTGSSTGSTGSGTGTTKPAANYQSSNWSGYLINSGVLTTVSGSWIAPSPTGNGSTTSADASWIGIGGVSSTDLIQVGTDNTVSASGQVTTGAFYEMLPAVSQNINGLTVTPGDSITASITETTTNEWSIVITDNTNKQTFTTTVSYTSSNSSAEWIEEDPSYSNGQLVPFDNYGSVSFSNCNATDNGTSEGISTASPDSITMINSSGQNISVPSNMTGNDFSVSWQSPG